MENNSKQVLAILPITKFALIFFVLSYFCLSPSCDADINEKYEDKFVRIDGNYKEVSLIITSDTIKLAVDSITANKFVYFNFQQIKEKPVLAFLDLNKRYYNIYNIKTTSVIAKLDMQKLNIGSRRITSTKIYIKNFDSIYVYANMNIYLIDSTMKVKDSIELLFSPYRASSFFRNEVPPVFIGNEMFVVAYPTLDQREMNDRKKWNMMYKINWAKHKSSLFYPLPKQFLDSVYEKLLLSPYYTYNTKKEYFVFSLPIDSNIYVTNFKTFGHFYSSASQYVKGHVPAYSKSDLADAEAQLKANLNRDIYGPIYYDYTTNRYIRISQQRLSVKDYNSKTLIKEHSVIILDEHFRIIGESLIDRTVSLSSLMVTENGIYARADINKNEDTVYLVRLAYKINNEVKHLSEK